GRQIELASVHPEIHRNLARETRDGHQRAKCASAGGSPQEPSVVRGETGPCTRCRRIDARAQGVALRVHDRSRAHRAAVRSLTIVIPSTVGIADIKGVLAPEVEYLGRVDVGGITLVTGVLDKAVTFREELARLAARLSAGRLRLVKNARDGLVKVAFGELVVLP